MPDSITGIVATVLGSGAVFSLLTVIVKGIFDRRKAEAEAEKLRAEAQVIQADANQRAAETSILRKGFQADQWQQSNSALQTALNSLESRFNQQEQYVSQTLALLQKSENDRKKATVEFEREKKRMLEQHHGLLAEYNELKAENRILTLRVDELEKEIDFMKSGSPPQTP